jgi:hypothetical protein
VKPLVEIDPEDRILVSGLRQVDLEGQEIRGVESVVLPLEGREALDQNSRPDKQDQGQGHLRGDQRRAHAGRSLASRHSSRTLAQVGRQVHTGAAQGRNQAEQERREHRDQAGEQQEPRVDSHFLRAGHGFGTDREQKPDSQVRDDQARQARQGRHEKALGEELANQPSTARAERRSDGDLAPSAQAAGRPGPRRPSGFGA